MTTGQLLTGAAAGRSLQETAPVPLTRLVQVELRKLVDTRSGRWLLVALGVLTAVVLTIMLFATSPEQLRFANFANATITPQSVLLPILGILTVTSEWGQRTGLVTFTLEPRRGRVAVAKLVAVILMGLLAVVVALALAAAANALGAAIQDGNGSWEFGLAGVRDIATMQLISVLQGLAFGMLFMNAPAAIVIYFALPTVWTVLTNLISWFQDIGRWVDLNTTSIPLAQHTMDADAWARLAVSVCIWVLLPLVLGWVRLLRRELKSA